MIINTENLVVTDYGVLPAVATSYTCHTEDFSSEVLLSSVKTEGVLTHVPSLYCGIANLF